MISVDEYNSYTEDLEQKLLEAKKEKEEADKRLLDIEIVLGWVSISTLLVFTFVAEFLGKLAKALYEGSCGFPVHKELACKIMDDVRRSVSWSDILGY